MSFKNNVIRAAILILSGSALSFNIGCGNYLGGKDTNEVYELKNKQIDCLKDFSISLQKFIKNELSEDRVEEPFACVVSAMELFQKKTIGSGGDSYKTKELNEFFRTYFLKEQNVSEELANELMRFKKAIVGGEDNILTKAEIKKLTLVVDVVRGEARELQKSMPLIVFQKETATLTEIQKAEEITSKLFKKILNRIELSDSDYSFKDMKKLLAEFVNYFKQKSQKNSFESIEKWLPLFESIRRLIIGENETLYGKEEFQAVSQNIVESYFLGQYYYYVIQKKSISDPKDLNQIIQFIEKAIVVVSQFHQMRSQNQFSFTSLDLLIDTLESYKFLPSNVSADAIKDLLKVLTARNFDPARHGDQRGLQAFERKHLQALTNEFRAWMNFQFWLNSTFPNSSVQISQRDLIHKLSALDLDSFLQSRQFHDQVQLTLNQTYFQELAKHLAKEDPINLTDSGKFVISRLKKNRWSWRNLTQLNTMMLLSRGLIIGYSSVHTNKYEDLRLTANDLEAWYSEYKKIGYDLKAFDSRSKNPGARSFYEANLFTLGANGDDGIDPDEAFDFLTLLISGGMFNTNQLFEIAEKNKCQLKEKDFFTNQWIDENCFLQALYKNLDQTYDHLPQFMHYMKNLQFRDFKAYWSDLLNAVRISAKDGGRLETADLRTVNMVIHYIESLMYTYDTNRDQYLDQRELKRAAVRFRSVFAKVAKVENHFILDQAFIYVVISGKIPAFNNVKNAVEDGLDFIKVKTSEQQATRRNLIQVFKLFKSL